MPKLTELRPMLVANDLGETIAFYKDQLGFECIGLWTPPAARRRPARVV